MKIRAIIALGGLYEEKEQVKEEKWLK